MYKGIKSCIGLIAAAGFFWAPSSHADFSSDQMIEGAKMCTRYLPRHEREFGIPMHLLAAISSTESGRYHKGLGIRLPWPWTINAEGQGYFFQSKAEAIAAVQRLQSKGIRSIDVGCMQVNLVHHSKAFASLEDAFEPAYNVSYAANFLHTNFEEMKSWRNATAAYHSRTPVNGQNYVTKVFDAWNRILTKVAEARSGPLAMAAGKWDMPKFSKVNDVENQMPRSSVASSTASGAIASASRSRSMRAITVTQNSTSRRENGVLVIRPQTTSPAQVTLASNDVPADPTKPQKPSVATLTTAKVAAATGGQFSPRSKIVRMGDGTSISVTKKPPQFVFDN